MSTFEIDGIINGIIVLLFGAGYLGYSFGFSQTRRLNNAPIKSTLVMRRSSDARERRTPILVTRLTVDDWMVTPTFGDSFVLRHESLAEMLTQDWEVGRA